MEISATTLLIRHFAIQKLRELLNKILCIPVAQGAAKLQEVKVGGPKIFFLRMCSKTFLLHPHLSKRMHSISFKSPHTARMV